MVKTLPGKATGKPTHLTELAREEEGKSLILTNSGIEGRQDSQSLLFAKALPDPDLRYLSNSTALDSSEKAK